MLTPSVMITGSCVGGNVKVTDIQYPLIAANKWVLTCVPATCCPRWSNALNMTFSLFNGLRCAIVAQTDIAVNTEYS